MKKYLAVARITFANILQYRWEFILVQVRAIIMLLVLYFLWTQVFSNRLTIFGFTKKEIITYVLLAAIFRQLVLISAVDQIANELTSWGKFFSYLLRPIGYFRYWFTVDLVYKIVSFVTIAIIAGLFIKVFAISPILPLNLVTIGLFTISSLIAILIYFYIGILVSTTGFWTTQVWGLQFLTVLILEFTAGVFFPIDVLPATLQSIIKLTPFPYLLYYPINVFLNRLTTAESLQVVLTGLIWLVLIYSLARFVWNRGLKVYEAWGG